MNAFDPARADQGAWAVTWVQLREDAEEGGDRGQQGQEREPGLVRGVAQRRPAGNDADECEGQRRLGASVSHVLKSLVRRTTGSMVKSV